MLCRFVTSLVPVSGASAIVFRRHSQKNICDSQDDTVNKVTGEIGAVSDRFHPVPRLKPHAPAATTGSGSILMGKVLIISEVWPLTSDPRWSLPALNVMSSSSLGVCLLTGLVVPRLSNQAHLREEELNVRAAPRGAEASKCATRISKQRGDHSVTHLFPPHNNHRAICYFTYLENVCEALFLSHNLHMWNRTLMIPEFLIL